MKKFFTLLFALTMVFTLAACSEDVDTKPEIDTQDTLVTLSYLSGGMLDTTTNPNQMVFKTLSNGNDDAGQGDSKVVKDLDQINTYMDQLKVFIDNGTNGFADVDEMESDNSNYESKLVFVVNEYEYVLYYNMVEEDIDGILIIEDVTYTLEGEENPEESKQEKLGELEQELVRLREREAADTEEQEDIDEDILDIEEEIAELQSEIDEGDDEDINDSKMKLVAKNGDDYIEIEYKLDTNEGTTTKFEIKEFIGGEMTEKEMKIVSEDGHYKIDVEENGNKLTFMKNTAEDGTMYKLMYFIDGERGQVMIQEETDENGETVYTYKIPGVKDITKGQPDSRGRDLDEDDVADDPNEV